MYSLFSDWNLVSQERRKSQQFVFVLLFGSYFASSLQAQEVIDFDQQIRPILSDRCYKCHGPDSETREADLRLDTMQDWSNLSSGSSDLLIIDPGAATRSELYQRLIADDEDMQMPPSESGLEVSEEERDAIRKWIDQGAEQSRHWSFVPVPEQIDPPSALPIDWIQNEIDSFVLAKQVERDLLPNALAAKDRLVRRLFLDLNGLPPTPAEVEQWSALPREEMVGRLAKELMSRPAFGEHLASQWLDAARYSDTYGYQVDRDRFVWPWRDWVVKSFNENLPYDQFLTQQIAGDLLPNATADQILATTFCRLHPQKVEGGSVPEEFRVEYVSDRVQTFSTAYLGLTLECCRCHDHKYDPLSQENYFQLSSFFDNIDEAGLYSYFTNSVPTPTLVLPDVEKDQQSVLLESKIAELSENHTKILAEIATESHPIDVSQIDASLESALVGQQNFDSQGVIGETSENKLVHRTTPGGSSLAVQLSGDEGIGLSVGNFRRWEPFSISLWMNSPDRKERAVVLHRSRAWTDAASRGYELLIEDGKLKFSLIHFWPGNAISIRASQDFEIRNWHHVTVTYDGSSTAEGLGIYVDGELQESDVIRDSLTKQITGGGNDNITLGERFRDRGFTDGIVDEVKVFNKSLNLLEVKRLSHLGSTDETDLPAGVEESIDAAQFWAEQNARDFKENQIELLAVRQKLFRLQDSRQEIMVMRESAEPRETYLLARGTYDAPTMAVETTTPEHIFAFSESLPTNRLGLARWATDPANPLTARVVVNRYWQLLFGEGLVRTPEDFGNQGAPPTHPLLLDFLARDLVEHQWDIQYLLTKIVESATYQQDSEVSAERRTADPENFFWTRYPDSRRSAEVLRDQALAVSGLLNDQIGGNPIFPYDLSEAFSPSKITEGDQQYRRSLYCYWKRTGPSPAMIALDAASRDVCQVKRERTQSPSQALVLFNAPQFVEAARAVAASVEPELSLDQKLEAVVLRMLQRPASVAELDVLRSLYEQQLAEFEQDPAAVEQYLSVGQFRQDAKEQQAALAALTAVVNTLFALDEFICRR